MTHSVSILSVPFSKGSGNKILEEVFSNIENSKDSFYVVTPNPEMIVLAQRDIEFRRALHAAGFSLPDGVGVLLAARFFGISSLHRITGVDFMDLVCKNASKKPVTVGFLGGRDGVAEKTADCLVKKYPGLKVVFVGEEWGKEGFVNAKKYHESRQAHQPEKQGKEYTTRQKLESHEIDILFVAYGFPKQELWMYSHTGKIPVRMMMGVGGAFDYISQQVPRAPKFLRSLGLEWFVRLVTQPWRIKRQRALLSFLFLIFKERFSQ